MTVDTAAEGNVNWPLAYQQLWDRYLALGEALDEERERVRVLTKYLSGFDITEDGEVRDEDGEPYEDTFIVNIGMQAAGIKEIHAALAAAKGES